jgi:RHS repeat-associated protein
MGSVLALVAALITGLRLFSGWGPAPASSAGSPVPVHTVHGRTVKVPSMHPYRRPPTSWPAPQTATAQIATVAQRKPVVLTAGPSAGSARVGSLPVWVGPPDASTGTLTSAFGRSPAVSRVQVAMASHATAAALGVRGAVFAVSRDDGSAAAGQVHVSVDYGSFAQAYGGDYASRLHLVELPACALTTPQVPACRKQAPVPAGSADNVRTSHVGADVTLPGLPTADTVLTAAVPRSVVLAVTTAPAGSGGNYAALPLSEQDEWVNGGSSGAYTDSYPITVPPVPGGFEPTVTLKYDSQAVDGLTSSTNNEASSIGDGWDYSPGFIQAEYPTCSTLTKPGTPQTGDLCAPSAQHWLTLSLNGTDSTLVNYSTSNGEVWKPEADNGAGVTEVTQTVGAETLPKYWKVTEPDGTTYWFGLNQLPGYTSGDPVTNSAWTVPVYDQLAQRTAPFFYPEVWRWNLDYVTDIHGDAIAYFYNTQAGSYAESNGTTANGQYVQGGVLSRIEYGIRDGSVYGTTPAAQVTFTTSSARQDAPDDLACAAGASCTVTSPTFWTDDALTGISTQSLAGSSLRNADSWALAGSYPATGDPTTSPSLWLSSITHTGQDGATPVTLPPTSFAGTPMPDRVQTAADTAAGYSLITRFRLTSVTSQTGGVTTIAYNGEDPACAAGTFPAKLSANTIACYPDFWTAAGSATEVEDWFNLYDVKSATVTDTTGGDPPVVTSYSYAGPAWHYDDDTVSRSATTTWDQWRGFRTVTTEAGTAPDPVTETADTYLQGMSDDELVGGCATYGCDIDDPVTITDTHGDKVTDADQYAAMLLESVVYNGAGTGSQVTDTISLPGTIVDSGIDPTTSVHAVEAGGTETITYTALAGGGTRESTVTSTDDKYGNVTKQISVPDTTDPSQTTCTVSNYPADTATAGNVPPVTDLPSWVTVLGTGQAKAPCGVNDSFTPTMVVSSTTYTYDSAYNITQTQKATAAAYNPAATNGLNIGFTYTPASTSTYDQYGRVLTSADADNRTTTTAYTPTAGAEPVSVQVTDPAGLVTTTTYDPARDLPLTVTDPAGFQTTKAYDALGRVTAEWTPGNPASGPAVDTYSYTDSSTAPSFSTEQTEEPGGNYLTTQTLDDSLGQVREVQQETAGGGTDVTDATYDSDGWKALTSDPYYVAGAPSGTLVAAAPASVPSQTGYAYDGAGRVLKQIAYHDGTETWETDSTYGGSYTTVVPPSGGTSQTTFTDGRGLTTAIYQYHAGATASPSDPASDYDKTSYTYMPAKQLAGITDAAGNNWSYTYDLLGNQLTQTYPDAGKTTSTYDFAGQLMTATDARGKQTSYTYDADGRKTAEYDTTGGALESTATQLASWTYDTLAKGQPTSSTAYEGGAAYTEKVTGYNSQELPSGTETVIPSAQGALAGTYTQQDTYAPDGQLASYTDSAAGGLPQETVTTGYNPAGEPDSLTGASSYADSLTYTTLSQPLQYTMGTSAEPAYITDTWDPQTSRLTEQNTKTTTAQTSVDDLRYTYDNVGNVTSEADTPSGDNSATDVQCFQYDYLDRLAQAWAQGSTGCAATPSASAEGGPAPYWDSYSYDVTGNLTGITSTSATGAVTTTASTYPAAGSARPHAITAATVTTSSGTASTSYGYDPSGNLTTVTGTSQSQALTWNDAGQLAQDAITQSGSTAKNTTYTYDADGTLLITADPASTTLYLPDEELTLNGSTVTGTRYYTLGGTTVATRTGASSVAYLAGDQQGTDSVAIDSATLNPTRRYYDPYGNPRGNVPSSFPAGEKGFIGGAADTATGLTDLGARQYQPTTGSFISTDPHLDAYNPQDLNPYAYAFGNPATNSDPSGTVQITGGGGGSGSCVGQLQYCQQQTKYTGAYGCTGRTQAAVDACVKSTEEANQPRGSTSDPRHSSVCPTRSGSCDTSQPILHAPHRGREAPVKKAPATGDPQCSPMSAHVGMCINGSNAGNPMPILQGIGQGILWFLSGVNWVTNCVDDFADDTGGESFTAATLVLMASGPAEPIAALKPGDKVLATNTKTGKTQAEPIADVLVHRDNDLYDLKIRAGKRTAVIATTRNHLFWVPAASGRGGHWVKAADLAHGTRLRTPDRANTATVVAGWVPPQHAGWMWDLSVPGNNDHDFYIDTVAAPVLVHNCPAPGDGDPEYTPHGAQRAADPSRLNPQQVADVIDNPTERYTQGNGAEVYVQEVDGRYNVVVRAGNRVVTNLKTISSKSLGRLAKNYGWTKN